MQRHERRLRPLILEPLAERCKVCETSALRRRPVEPERIERMVSGIVRRLENLGESEVPAKLVGELVMEGLYALDQVGYVRFASVYRNFREAKDFEEFLGEMSILSDDEA